MADQTFTLYVSATAFASQKVMAYIQNNHASEAIYIRRVGLCNPHTATVTGVIVPLELRFCTAATFTTAATTGCTVQTHDTGNSAPTTYAYGIAAGITPTASQILRRVHWSNDEIAAGAATYDEIETNIPLNIVFDAGYGDSSVQPVRLRQGQCFYILANSASTVGTLDVWIEFTKV